jgi:hypothetical protein
MAKTIAHTERYEILAKASGGKLTADEVYNLEKYGVKNPRELSDLEEHSDGRCCCGELDCNEQYVHWTSGW